MGQWKECFHACLWVMVLALHHPALAHQELLFLLDGIMEPGWRCGVLWKLWIGDIYMDTLIYFWILVTYLKKKNVDSGWSWGVWSIPSDHDCMHKVVFAWFPGSFWKVKGHVHLEHNENSLGRSCVNRWENSGLQQIRRKRMSEKFHSCMECKDLLVYWTAMAFGQFPLETFSGLLISTQESCIPTCISAYNHLCNSFTDHILRQITFKSPAFPKNVLSMVNSWK
jgi:hypothetical protein